MASRRLGLLLVVTATLGIPVTGVRLGADNTAAAISGTVRSKVEGPMEGVVVIAQREGSSVLTAVTTNERGEYMFPRTHLRPGTYSLTIRAAGYVLPGGPASVRIDAQTPARLGLVLHEVTPDQLAHQLTSVEWWNSMSGTPAQKDLLIRTMVNCGFCHDMERIMRTHYTADEFLTVMGRMATYAADNSSACGTGSEVSCDPKTGGRVQVQSEARPAQGPQNKAIAEYLASINLSGGRTLWNFPLKPMPRPRGRATRAIVTVFPVPRQPSVIHDLTVDRQGNVWYGDSGWGYLGKLEPATGTFHEYQAPQSWPDPRPGMKRIVGVQDVEVDTAGRVWAVIGFLGKKMAYFDPRTEQWTTFDVPAPVWAFLPGFHGRQMNTIWTTSTVAQSDLPPRLTAFRLNATLGRVDVTAPVGDGSGQPFCYQVERDPNDNMICAAFYNSNITVVDSKTGVSAVYPTPTPHAGPRRGRADDEGHFWFGEFLGDKAAVFDSATKSIREFAFSQKYMSAYAAAPDHHGEGWASSTGSDRVLRVNPKTGETTEYLMPVYYDARKVVVDPSTSKTTIWLPNKNLSQLIRVEPLD
jgi:streptogramin lyase